MKIALCQKHYDMDHLKMVMRQMEKMGAPTIRCVFMPCYHHWAALEGTHRLRAAHILGLTPIIEELEYDDTTLSSHGIQDESGEEYTVSQICDDSQNMPILNFM